MAYDTCSSCVSHVGAREAGAVRHLLTCPVTRGQVAYDTCSTSTPVSACRTCLPHHVLHVLHVRSVTACRMCLPHHVLRVLHVRECNRLSNVSTPPRAPRAPRGGCNGRLSNVSTPPRAPRAPLEIPKMGVDPNVFALFAHLPSNHCVRTKIWLSTLVAWHETRSSNASTRRDAQRSRCQSVKPCRCTDRQETCDSGLRTGRKTRANPPG